MPSYSGVWNLPAVMQAVGAGTWPPNYVEPRALIAAGEDSSGTRVKSIDTILISTAGNATNFGDLSSIRSGLGSCGSSNRAIFGGGYSTNYVSAIDYFSFGSTGSYSNFGNLTTAIDLITATSNSTRGIFAGGEGSGGKTNVIQYITIASAGNATDFGDLVYSGGSGSITSEMSSCASTTRGVFAGGTNSVNTVLNVIQYITIATTGNSLDFGDLLQATQSWNSGCSSSIRGVFAGGELSGGGDLNVIQYITIASTGNATDFGDLTLARRWLSAASSQTRATFCGGRTSIRINVIDYVTIASTGNATDFGDLTTGRESCAACSNAHGGL